MKWSSEFSTKTAILSQLLVYLSQTLSNSITTFDVFQLKVALVSQLVVYLSQILSNSIAASNMF